MGFEKKNAQNRIPNHPAPLGYSPEDEVNLPRIAWSTNLYLCLYPYLILYFYLNLYLYLYVYLYFCLYLTHSSAFDLAQGNTTMKSTTKLGLRPRRVLHLYIYL